MTTVSFRKSTSTTDTAWTVVQAINVKAMLGKMHWAAKKNMCKVALWEMSHATVEIFQFANGYVRVTHYNDMLCTKVETHKRLKPTTYIACFANTITCKQAVVVDAYVTA